MSNFYKRSYYYEEQLGFEEVGYIAFLLFTTIAYAACLCVSVCLSCLYVCLSVLFGWSEYR